MLHNFTNLELLSLFNVNISSPIPVNISSSLRYLDLGYPNLRGVLTESFFLPPNSLETLKLSGISGELPHSIGTFSSLNHLNLYGCQFSGSIPDSIGNLTQITELDLSLNHFTGHIPSTISKLKHLTILVLRPIPFQVKYPDVFSNLQKLRLSSNSLSGPLPSKASMLQKLSELDLSDNLLNGTIPSWVFNIPLIYHKTTSVTQFHCLGSMASLTMLDLRRNNFTGSLPPFCAQSTSLSTIVVNGNRFEGPVPVSLLNCNGLEVLDVGNNAINDTYPAWLGILQELQWLTSCKSFWKLQGKIKLDDEDTKEIKYMEPSEKSIYISYEDSVSLVIKGQDIELQRISTIMTTIDLSSNHFEGAIPKTLKDLSSLWLLNLSHNNLKGDIPRELGKLNMLEALDLSWNRLTGKIPQELTRMNFLKFLNLSQNHLVGPIPQDSQFNTFEKDLYGGNIDLCGLPLSKQCGTSDSSHVPQPLESEEDEGESYFFSGFTWESVVIGYSFGLVVGTIMWSLMFKYRKPKWFVEFFKGIFPKKMRRPKKRAQRRQT
ncbi:hypothetical protein KY284_026186 [Solanum tuberosum]|nr:hypothetical protein KY284_026186 [Solanum tuberosum]